MFINTLWISSCAKRVLERAQPFWIIIFPPNFSATKQPAYSSKLVCGSFFWLSFCVMSSKKKKKCESVLGKFAAQSSFQLWKWKKFIRAAPILAYVLLPIHECQWIVIRNRLIWFRIVWTEIRCVFCSFNLSLCLYTKVHNRKAEDGFL